ncbi:hypothetical protein JX266_010608 [Neoarthrinium moseri]|nr:hypothetical protein JX266_010608 [Neoarthrinium moseri]
MAHENLLLPLPLEIWVRVLSSITDSQLLPQAWLNCRLVSRGFRVATETAFVGTYLPQMKLCVELTELLELTFFGVSPDRTLARFTHVLRAGSGQSFPLRMPLHLQRRLEQETERIWQREHERYVKSIQEGAPSLLYTCWVEGFVEDPPFLGLEVDVARRMLSFRWQPTLSTMFGEIEHRRQLLSQVERGEGRLSTTDRMREIEMQVRKQRPRNQAWNQRFDPERRQDWQLNALMGYRTLICDEESQ